MEQAPSDGTAHMHLMTAVKRFMTIGGQSTTHFNMQQASLYLGLQFEELGEKIEEVAKGAVAEGDRLNLSELSVYLKKWGLQFKNGFHQGAIARADRAALLNADFDLAFVSAGAIFSTSTDGIGAVWEGCRSNLDKYRNGVVLKDANGKVQRPEGWTKPNFEKFVDVSDQQPDS